MREIVFGEDYAYLPMTQSGAMGAGDTLRVMRQCPHFRDFLPNDAHGRTVACSDWTTFRPSDLCEGNRYDPVRIHWLRLYIHRQSGTRLSHELEDFGFERRNLPKSMGGIFEWNPNWVNEQREREDDA